jgi:hypothetical protein
MAILGISIELLYKSLTKIIIPNFILKSAWKIKKRKEKVKRYGVNFLNSQEY